MSFETLNRFEAIDIGMADENNNSQREAKASKSRRTQRGSN